MTRHPTDVLSLVLGAVFGLLGLLWFAVEPDDYAEQLVWAGPAALVVVGLALLVAAVRRSAGRDARDAYGP